MSDEHEVRPADDDMSDAIWADGALFDPLSTDSFSQELANIDESDWNVDADLIWGEEAAGGVDPGGEAPEADFLG